MTRKIISFGMTRYHHKRTKSTIGTMAALLTRLQRRRKVVGLSLILGALISAQIASASTACPTSRPIRLATVRNVQDGGLLALLVREFQEQTGCRVHVYVGKEVYEQARAGKADIVLSHFAHEGSYGLKQCVDAGICGWPIPVLLSADAILAPMDDPAHMGAAHDPVEAFRRIAASHSPFVVNDQAGLKYVTTVLWNAAGRPTRSGWYIDEGAEDEDAARLAASKHAYSIWGATAFQRAKRTEHWPLKEVLFKDELLERLMVCSVVRGTRSPSSNVAGALAFVQYLLRPSTQAKIRGFRSPGIQEPTFAPAGRNNLGSLLAPKVSP